MSAPPEPLLAKPSAAPLENESSSTRTSGNLPPVEPPSGKFILQLFLIPLLIVSIVVLLWLLFSWVAHMGRGNAVDLAKSIERGDAASWQRAYELADLLRSPDRRYDELRRDSTIAKRLAEFLERDLAQPVSGPDGRARVMRRMYLCRVLGSFHVPDGLNVLLRAAQEERDPLEIEVRYSALEAIATLANNCGPEALREDEKLLPVVLEVSRATDGAAPPPTSSAQDGTRTIYRPHAELRAVAAYTLGVIGGDAALERLRRMLHDPYPNARFNAATGLARAGDAECEGTLKEMLDPDNDSAVSDERYADDRARKRTTVLLNGIKATLLLAENNPSADLSRLKDALRMLTTSSLDGVTISRTNVKNTALEALRLIDVKVAPRPPTSDLRLPTPSP